MPLPISSGIHLAGSPRRHQHVFLSLFHLTDGRPGAADATADAEADSDGLRKVESA